MSGGTLYHKLEPYLQVCVYSQLENFHNVPNQGWVIASGAWHHFPFYEQNNLSNYGKKAKPMQINQVRLSFSP